MILEALTVEDDEKLMIPLHTNVLVPWPTLNRSRREKVLGFPGGAVVESPPADAGDTGSCPRPGRSHMPRSGWAPEPWPLSLRIRSLCSATGEALSLIHISEPTRPY